MGWKICLNTVLVDVDIQMVQIHKFSQTSSVASIKLPFGQRLVGVRVVFHIKMLSKLFAKKKMLSKHSWFDIPAFPKAGSIMRSGKPRES
jgi:hypothetical protein